MNAPERFNIADAICKRHADAVTRIALLDEKIAGYNTYTFGGLDFISDKFAAVLSQRGITKGDAVAILLPQSAASLTAHFGALKVGAAVVELSLSLQKELIEQALKESRAKVVVAQDSISAQVFEIAGNIGSIHSLFAASDKKEDDNAGSNVKRFWHEIYKAPADFTPVDTASGSAALMIYETAPEGNSRLIVRSHASLIDQLAAFETNNEITARSIFWSAIDWAEEDSLLGFIFPALWHGCAVVAAGSSELSAEEITSLFERRSITGARLPAGELEKLKLAAEKTNKQDRMKLLFNGSNPVGITHI